MGAGPLLGGLPMPTAAVSPWDAANVRFLESQLAYGLALQNAAPRVLDDGPTCRICRERVPAIEVHGQFDHRDFCPRRKADIRRARWTPLDLFQDAGDVAVQVLDGAAMFARATMQLFQ